MAGLDDIDKMGFFTPLSKELLKQAAKDSTTLSVIRDTGRKGHLEDRQRTDEQMLAQNSFITAFRAMVQIGLERGYLMDDPYDGISEMTYERDYHERVWDETEEEYHERVKDLPPVTFKVATREHLRQEAQDAEKTDEG